MVASLKGSFCKVCKVFLVLLPHIVIFKIVMSVFNNFEFNVVVDDVDCRRKVDSLAPLLLTFANLLADVCHTI
jgi:hypothetical protein